MPVLGKLRARVARPPVNTSRVHLREFAAEAAASGSGKDFKVLDAGAGSVPYGDLFAHVDYETADMTQGKGPKLTYICDVSDLPMADDTYDMVFSSQTLEHVKDPLTVLSEYHRVLKPGGEAWLTAPLFYPEHLKPYDYFRYTRFAWRDMARKVGLQVESIRWLEGYYGTLSFQLQMAHKALPREMRATRIALLHLSRRLAKKELAERYTPKKGMPKNYKVVLVKPEA